MRRVIASWGVIFRRGFTLFEMLVAIFLSTLLLLILIFFVNKATRLFELTQSTAESFHAGLSVRHFLEAELVDCAQPGVAEIFFALLPQDRHTVCQVYAYPAPLPEPFAWPDTLVKRANAQNLIAFLRPHFFYILHDRDDQTRFKTKKTLHLVVNQPIYLTDFNTVEHNQISAILPNKQEGILRYSIPETFGKKILLWYDSLDYLYVAPQNKRSILFFNRAQRSHALLNGVDSLVLQSNLKGKKLLYTTTVANRKSVHWVTNL